MLLQTESLFLCPNRNGYVFKGGGRRNKAWVIGIQIEPSFSAWLFEESYLSAHRLDFIVFRFIKVS